MIENDIQKLTAAIEQLTVTAEALLETLRHQPAATEGKGSLKKLVEDFAAKPDIVVMPITSLEMQPAPEEPAPKPKKAKAPKAEEPAPAPEPVPVAEVPREYTIAMLRDAAQKALDAGKLNEVVLLNKHYGVKRISEVSPELYGEIIAKLEALANGQT
jgi:hypothetical protein